jgi:oxygen-independent coproporphyrinogen-3 oxidase
MKARALYVHIPFCRKKCSYCDFYSIEDATSLAEDYLVALGKELLAHKGLRPATIYVGGGTPTALAAAQLQRLFEMLKEAVDFSRLSELTVEANPDTVDETRLSILKASGVNRMSVGIQSFNDRHLALLGRLHSASAAEAALERLLEAGFRNISADLIFGIPTQTVEESGHDIAKVVEYPVSHVSAYSLTCEKGTPLAKAVRAGVLSPVSEEDEKRMYLQAIEILSSAGVRQYEISNFARKGYECRHNITYWRNDEYVGIGASAVSYRGGERKKNVADVRKYIGMIADSGAAAVWSERLDPERSAREKAVMNLRMTRGISRISFQRETGFDIEELFAEPIAKHADSNLLRYDGKRLHLTVEGFLVADEILSDFV